MTDSFEKKLQGALKPVDPGADFTAGVLARLGEAERLEQSESSPPAGERKAGERTVGRSAMRGRWLAIAMAASLAAVVVGVQIREQREREAGLRASEQLRAALKVTSEKLNLAYRVVHDQSQGATREKTQSDPKSDPPNPPDHSGA